MTEAEQLRQQRRKRAVEREDIPEGLSSLAGMTEQQLDIIEREKAKSYKEGQASVHWWREVVVSVAKIGLFVGLLGGSTYFFTSGAAAETYAWAQAKVAEIRAPAPPAERAGWEDMVETKDGLVQELRLDRGRVCHRLVLRGFGGDPVYLGCTGVKVEKKP